MNKYKISHIINGAVKYIYVFNGKHKNRHESMNKLFTKKPTGRINRYSRECNSGTIHSRTHIFR